MNYEIINKKTGEKLDHTKYGVNNYGDIISYSDKKDNNDKTVLDKNDFTIQAINNSFYTKFKNKITAGVYSTDFQKWFRDKLIISGYPVPTEIRDYDFDIIINVSDEFISCCADKSILNGKSYFWFPMSECNENMGLHSIYGACQILNHAEKNNLKVLLHCHAGIGRSVTVAECYYYTRTEIMLNNSVTKERGIDCGHLPSYESFITFLKEIAKVYEREETHKGGFLDMCLLNSGLNKSITK